MAHEKKPEKELSTFRKILQKERDDYLSHGQLADKWWRIHPEAQDLFDTEEESIDFLYGIFVAFEYLQILAWKKSPTKFIQQDELIPKICMTAFSAAIKRETSDNNKKLPPPF